MKKHREIKRISLALLLCGALTLGENMYLASQIPYTSEDLKRTGSFVTSLKTIENTSIIEFENKELETYFKNSLGEITPEKIKGIKELVIDCTLTDNNYSDLKYFTNLEELTIRNATIDLKDLEYNQSLKQLNLIDSTVTNTKSIPNTVCSLAFLNCILADDLMYLPYHLGNLAIYQTGFTNIKPKNPHELRWFFLDSNISKVDLSFLNNCSRIEEIKLATCPNVTHPEALKTIPKNCKVYLDDYAPIWLDLETYNSLNVVSEYDLSQEIDMLDHIASALVPDMEVDEATKLAEISNFIIANLQYSQDVIDENKDYENIADSLNRYPIKYALDINDSYDEVCINYACLFQALANRVGIESTQLMSEFHTWNIVNGKYIDLTSLDVAQFYIPEIDRSYTLEQLLDMGEEIPEYIYYVGDVTDPFYEELYHFNEPETISNNIGYVKKNDDKIMDAIRITKNMLVSIVFISLLSMIANAYDYLRYHRLEEDINKKIESMTFHK